MADTSDKEAELLLRTVFSIPRVFETRGTPDDLNLILSHLKQAVCHRGISVAGQRLLINLLAPLGSFKAGLIDTKQLQARVYDYSAEVATCEVYTVRGRRGV